MKLMERIKSFIFNPADDEYEEYEEIVDDGYDYGEANSDIPRIGDHRARRSAGIVNRGHDTIAITSKKPFKSEHELMPLPASNIVFSEPKNVDEASGICDLIKQGKTVVVKMEDVKVADGQRIMDFLGGAAYYADGSVHQVVSNRVYIVAPKGMEVTEHHKEQLRAHGVATGGLRLFGGR
ncbi:MAG: cell division protein SepF [Clostridiales bacterium]|jgi:cell division inhibitor SepF|nr:cell division protein SepF [Clostridiales bacterium]